MLKTQVPKQGSICWNTPWQKEERSAKGTVESGKPTRPGESLEQYLGGKGAQTVGFYGPRHFPPACGPLLNFLFLNLHVHFHIVMGHSIVRMVANDVYDQIRAISILIPSSPPPPVCQGCSPSYRASSVSVSQASRTPQVLSFLTFLTV